MSKERLTKKAFMKLTKEQLWVKYSREGDQVEQVQKELEDTKEDFAQLSTNAQVLSTQLTDTGRALQDQKRVNDEYASKYQKASELVGFLSKTQPIELVQSVDDRFAKPRTTPMEVEPFKTYEKFEVHDHDGKVFQTLIVLVIEELEDKIKGLVVKESSNAEEKIYLGKLVYITKEFQQKKLNWLQKLRLKF